MLSATPPQSFAAAARAGLIALLPVLCMSCDDAPETEQTVTPASENTDRPARPRITWLDANSNVTPEQWLASREVGVDLAEADPKVEAMRAGLRTAATRFGEETRMIANRAVQLENMLAAQGIHEHAPELIEALSTTATTEGLKQGFGSVCQHYFNLRQQGLGRDAALEQLKKTSLLRPQHEKIEAS